MAYEVYVDGACSKNPGKGAYAFVVCNEAGKSLVRTGYKEETTNNQMELMAIVEAIKFLLKKSKSKEVTIRMFSDSAYCVNAVNFGWMKLWEQNGWRTKAGETVKNKELWVELKELLDNKKLKLNLIKVKGHSGNMLNELVDKAAKKAIKEA